MENETCAVNTEKMLLIRVSCFLVTGLSVILLIVMKMSKIIKIIPAYIIKLSLQILKMKRNKAKKQKRKRRKTQSYKSGNRSTNKAKRKLATFFK